MKIVDLINEAAQEGFEGDGKDQPFVSLEYFPPRTEKGVQNLRERLHRIKVGGGAHPASVATAPSAFRALPPHPVAFSICVSLSIRFSSISHGEPEVPRRI
jgi:hypothetical protein